MELVIGSRGSQLALWQAEWAKSTLEASLPGAEIRIEVIRTTGDRDQAASFRQIGGKGVFTKEVDDALLAGRTHLSVHSLKDLPTDLPPGLCLAAVSARADARDALISTTIGSFDQLPSGARVGTSSLRRQAVLRAARPDLSLEPLRGNVDTRLRKLKTEGLDAIVLAAAGLTRLGLTEDVCEYLDPAVFTPAPGQGVMGIVVREADEQTRASVEALHDAEALAAVTAERTALHILGGGCRIPFGAHAVVDAERVRLTGVVGHPTEAHVIRSATEGSTGEPEAIGMALAEDLLEKGAQAILDEAEV